MGVQIEGSMLSASRDAEALAGTEAAGEFRCAECGYGAVVHRALPPCPMCAGTVWERRGPVALRLVD